MRMSVNVWDAVNFPECATVTCALAKARLLISRDELISFIYTSSLVPGKVALSDRCCSSGSNRYLTLLIVRESFAHNDSPSLCRRKVITSTVYPYQLGCKAPAIANVLDHELTSSLYSLSDGATFSGNRLGLICLPEAPLICSPAVRPDSLFMYTCLTSC